LAGRRGKDQGKKLETDRLRGAGKDQKSVNGRTSSPLHDITVQLIKRTYASSGGWGGRRLHGKNKEGRKKGKGTGTKADD